MKRFIFSILCSAFLFTACMHEKIKGIVLEGEIQGVETSEIIIGKAVHQAYDQVFPIDTIHVREGKFTYTVDSLPSGVYGFYVVTDTPTNNAIVYAFLQQGKTKVDISLSSHRFLTIKASGTPLANEYQAFSDELYVASERQVIDSLDNLFYQARIAQDDDAMDRIKSMSIPYYAKGDESKKSFIRDITARQLKKPLGIYFYYNEIFLKKSHTTLDDINRVKDEINSFDAEAKSTFYYTLMNDRLIEAEKSVVGAIAPEISGIDSNGHSIKLSDFRGKYVLLDFWSSGCSWCRAETPNIRKAYEDNKNKKLVVLAASLDMNEEDWIKAMKEDNLTWPSLLMPYEEIKAMNTMYNVQGIPLILLIDPNGRIIERDMRGPRIYEAVAEYVK